MILICFFPRYSDFTFPQHIYMLHRSSPEQTIHYDMVSVTYVAALCAYSLDQIFYYAHLVQVQ